MIKKIAWETFKNTGDINSFIELKQIENIEKQIQQNCTNNYLDNQLNIEEKKEENEMSNTKINGIVLSENNMGDFDKMLTILTPNVRKNIMCCQRGKKTKKCSFGWYTDVLLW